MALDSPRWAQESLYSPSYSVDEVLVGTFALKRPITTLYLC